MKIRDYIIILLNLDQEKEILHIPPGEEELYEPEVKLGSELFPRGIDPPGRMDDGGCMYAPDPKSYYLTL